MLNGNLSLHPQDPSHRSFRRSCLTSEAGDQRINATTRLFFDSHLQLNCICDQPRRLFLKELGDMGGPIVRTGTTPAFWQNWESVFGKKDGGKKKAAVKEEKPAADATPVKKKKK